MVAADDVKRRLAAILAADVVGFSRLTGADEEGTLARLRTLRAGLIDPTVRAHGGRIVKGTGDGVLCEFGSVVDAVRCAVDIQRGVIAQNVDVMPDERIDLRIGVHLGDVVVEPDGDLMGDGVNIAARLEGIAEPGGISLSSAAYEQVRDKFKGPFVDLGEKLLKNIVRPMRVYALEPDGTTPTREAGIASARPIPSPGPPHLSIVVLPFANMGSDPEQDYFVDGVTESLTTDLSRIAGSLVIGRHTAFTYKGKSIDLKLVGRELNVRYALEGSVQRGGGRIRVNVQLIDAESGNHLWADRFDKPVADLFEMQDEIVGRLAGALNAQLVAAEARRAERSPSPDSMDCYFQGLAWLNKGWTSQNTIQAQSLFEQALDLDENNVDALVGFAFADVIFATALMTDDRAIRLANAERTAAMALHRAPNHAWAHYVLAVVLSWTRRPLQGIAACERALACDRNLMLAHAMIGYAKFFIGRPEETEAHVREALRLSPLDTLAYIWMAFLAVAKFGMGAEEEAILWLQRSIERNRNFPVAHFVLAGVLAHCGRMDEARSAVAAGLALDPTFTVRRFRQGEASDHPAYVAPRTRLYDGIRKAGVPEG